MAEAKVLRIELAEAHHDHFSSPDVQLSQYVARISSSEKSGRGNGLLPRKTNLCCWKHLYNHVLESFLPFAPSARADPALRTRE